MDDTRVAVVEVPDDPDLSEAPTTGAMDIVSSRALAVDRIIRGGTLALLGLGLGSAMELLHLGPPLVRVSGIALGMVLGAAGCIWAGRGASHLLRFGRSGHSLTLMSLGGLGLSFGCAGAARMFAILGIPGAAALLYRLAGIAVPIFGVILVVTVLHSLIRLLFVDRDSDEPITE